jgi:hypothetical protein
MADPQFRGEPVTVGGTTIVVPPLGLLAVQTLLPKIASIALDAGGDVANPFAQLQDLLDICYTAVKRNYPELERQAFAESIDFAEFVPLVNAVMRQSGFRSVTEKNEEEAGSHSTGTSSTPASSLPSAGAGSTSTST